MRFTWMMIECKMQNSEYKTLSEFSNIDCTLWSQRDCDCDYQFYGMTINGIKPQDE